MNQPIPPHLEPYTEQIDALREVGHHFWQKGWSVGTSSNYSAVVSRDPLTLIVTASGKHKGKLERGDFVLTGADGQPTIVEQPKSSAETLLHCLAASNPNVGAVLHTHSVWATILSDRFSPQGGILLEGFEMLKGLSGVTTHLHSEWLPIFANSQDIPELAERVRTAAKDTKRPFPHAYLIRKHGIYTWGKDIDEAFRHVEIIEFLLECVARQSMM